MDKNKKDFILQVKNELEETSTSFCLAKWLQVTIHLQNGMTHSCHHPPTHKVPLSEIEVNPSALHNTQYKKKQRKKMVEGVRPTECDYCWKIEDAHPNNISDRTYKSADDWAYPHFNEVTSQTWEQDIDPTYLEISFGNECQFKCAYCSPTISSGILSEFQKFGHYQVDPYFSLDNLKSMNQYPYTKDQFNPYVKAFWDWWPNLSKKLEVFRITGGEPLLNPNTFRFLEAVIKDPMPKLDLAINSNLSVPDVSLDKFLNLSQNIIQNQSVKKFEIYTSVDTIGPQAEYIRNGLQFDKFILNVRKVLDTLPGVKIIFMCTFNALSVPRFTEFLIFIKDLKKEYPMNEYSSRIELSISFLRRPMYMAANILPSEYIELVEKSLDYMLRNSMDGFFQTFSEYEISHLRNIVEWLKHNDLTDKFRLELQNNFVDFFDEYDRRKGTNLTKTFPEFENFIKQVRSRRAISP